jgi:hypothetical protein
VAEQVRNDAPKALIGEWQRFRHTRMNNPARKIFSSSLKRMQVDAQLLVS